MPRPRFKPEEVPHGTVAGYDWHQRWRVPVCESCREAKRKASRERSRLRRQARAEDAKRMAAWQSALNELVERHSAEFREILTEKMRGLVSLPPEGEGTE